MARRICPFTMSFAHMIAMALLFVPFIALTGVASAQNPVPLISQPLVPDAVKPGSAGFTLTVNGTGFVWDSVVKWSGSARATTFVSKSQLKATILFSDVAKPGTASVTVINPSPGGGTSNVAFFDIAIATSAIVLDTSGFGAGASPSSVAVGDFNGDGKLDMAVANFGSASISILLGNGDGTFKPPVYYGLGPGSHHPTSVAVGDFNGDNRLDLAVANGGSNDVSVFLGNGDGTFRSAVSYVTNSDLQSVVPSSVAVGDFKRDGHLDLAVANPGGLSVLLGNGDGTFKPFVNYAAGSTPYWVAVGDFNGDGKLDLAVANEGSNDLSVLLGKGDGTFEAAVNYATGSQPASVAVGDFNGDGKLDVAVANMSSNNVSVLLGNGDGTFRPAINYAAGSGSRTVAVGDFNGDGKLDLVVANNGGTGSVSLLLGNGNGTFHTAVDYTAGVQPEWVAVGDFNGDGRPDIAVADIGSSSSKVFVLNTTAIFGDELVGNASPVHPVSLTNYGATPLTIAGITITGANSSDFAQTNSCGREVAPGTSCAIDVTFTPSRIGTRTAILSITDNAPGGSQNVTLNGAGTVVELAPSSLSFTCSSSCPPPAQAVTLTNTGTASLSLGISITGSTTFSQTNTCGSSVMAKGSCTITVTFNSSSRGTFNGALAVRDNGGGSPQQVPLSGTRSKPRGAGALAVRSAMVEHSAAAVPSSTGHSHIGTRIIDLVDSSRDNPFLTDRNKRELLVRFWYPASITQGCVPAEYTSPAVWSYFSQLTEFLLPEIKTNSCQDAPITDDAHPVVVFTHGYTGTFTDYTFLFEDLASRGYVVASVDHTYEATAVEFPDGRLVKSVFGSHLAESTWRRDEQGLSFAVSVRSKDLKFVVDELARLNIEAGGPFAGKLDLTKVAVAGHSLGGLAALLGLKQDARFKAAVLLDASMSGGSASVTKKPVLVLAMGREQWSDEECQLWSDLRGPRFAVNLMGAEHLTPSDAVWLAKGAIKTGSMGPEKSIAALRDYIGAFLDANLRGKPFDPLLTGPSSDYPDAEVTTETQSMCSKAIDH